MMQINIHQYKTGEEMHDTNNNFHFRSNHKEITTLLGATQYPYKEVSCFVYTLISNFMLVINNQNMQLFVMYMNMK